MSYDIPSLFPNESEEFHLIANSLFNTSDNMIVEALAGTGKTRLFVMLMQMMSKLGIIGPGARTAKALMYGREASKDFSSRLGFTPGAEASTYHSLAYSACKKGLGSHLRVDADLKRQMIMERLDSPTYLTGFILKLLALGQNNLLGTDPAPWFEQIEHHDLINDLTKKLATVDYEVPPIDELLEMSVAGAIRALQISEDIAVNQGLVNFDDQLYLAATRFNRHIWKSDYVFSDESQDNNKARLVIAGYAGRRLLFVGDRYQAIFGFTGADVQSMDNLKDTYKCKVFTLSTNYRCSIAVLGEAQMIVPTIQAAPGAIEGSVSRIVEGGPDDPWFLKVDGGLSPKDAGVCRITSLLIRQAYRLYAAGIPCHVEGRKIGEGIVNLLKKLAGKKINDLATLESKLQSYKATELEKLIKAGKEVQAQAIEDKCDSLQVFIDHNPESTVTELQSKIAAMFQDGAQTFTLCTGHRSKGREWDKVYWFDKDRYQPSPYARKPWQLQQETNLAYVMATRAKQDLIYVSTYQEVAKKQRRA